MTSYVRSCSDEIGRILRYIESGRVWLLYGVFFCIVGSIIVVFGYLGTIYSFSGVKVTQGHDCHGPFS